MSEFRNEASDGIVVLNNVPLKVSGGVGWQLLNSYGRKIQQGDPGPQDHHLDSTITQASWTGGIGTKRYRGDDALGNSWFSTMWMQTENVLCLPTKTFEFTLAGQEGNLAFVHDQLVGYQWGSIGLIPVRWNESSDVWETPPGYGSSTSTPVNKGVTWGNASVSKKMYIPMGTTYEVFNGTSYTAGAVGETAVAFAVWEQKLFKLGQDGVVKVTVDGATWTEKGRINSSESPRNLFVFYDKSNNQLLHVVSSGRLYGLDYTNATLIETDMWWPTHPSQGYGVTRWRGDAYISAGLGIHRNNNGLIQAVGPDGRDGLPQKYAGGYFTDLIGGYNGMYGVLVSGDLAYTPATETSDAGTAPPEQMYSQDPPVNCMMMEYNGLGWFPQWEGTNRTTTITTSANDGVYRVFWGTKGYLYSKILPMGYYNPSYNQNQSPLAPSARHETPFFTWGFDGVDKILKLLEVQTIGCSSTEYFDVWYRTSEDDDWTFLDKITTNGEHHIEIGFEDIAGKSFHSGLKHERVQFAFDAYRGSDEYKTPAIEWYQIVGRKWMRPMLSFQFQVDAIESYSDLSPFAIFLHCLRAATKKGGSVLVVGNKTFPVDITSLEGEMAAGLDFMTSFNIHAALITEVDDLADQLDTDG